MTDLKKINFFALFDSDELSRIEKHLALKSYQQDDVIISHNEINKKLYIVMKGKVKSTMKLPKGIERSHGTYSAGDVFGVISLFGNKLPIADYTAAETCELLAIHEEGILNLVENDSSIAIKFISYLLNRTIQHLRESSRFLTDVVQWGENASRRVITDEMTGIYNKEFLEDALENFFNISKSNNKPLSLLMMDIDGYRKINQEIGYETANRVMLDVVGRISDIISKHGIIARYGGDEFSILLPEADLAKAYAIAEQIRMDVESYDISKHVRGEKIALTLSIGISSYPETATDFETFKKKADDSLYRAKEVGKNRVVYLK